MNPAIHAAVAAARRRREKEEEQMSGYNPAELEGWEFKIVRSHFGRFGNPEVLSRLVSEESQNGWEMLEKFDNFRIRFKRRVGGRSLHSGGDIDPYRTQFGTSPVIMPVVAVLVALVLGGVMYLMANRTVQDIHAAPVIVAGLLLVLALVAVVIRRRNSS